MKNVLIMAGLFIYLACAGQQVVAPEGYEALMNLRELGSMDGLGNVKTFDTRYEGVKGSPNVFESWHPGEVYMKNRGRIGIEQMNYNSFQNEIVYMDPDTYKHMTLDKYLVDFFRIFNEDTLLFVPVIFPEETEPVFAQVIYNKKSQVYKVYRKEYLQANYGGGYSADRRYDEFVDKHDLYFRKHDENVLYKLRRPARRVKKAFGEDSGKISSFIKSNDLKFKDEKDLLRLMVYYDSL